MTARSLTALLAAALLLAAGPSAADTALELKVKSALLYNFARYVTWPAGKFTDTTSPIRICVLQPDPFGSILDDTLNGKQVNERPLTIQRGARAADLRDCHIVYATGSTSALEAAFAELAGAGAVTVHDHERALTGGVMRFFLEGNKVRFEINTLAAERERLELSLRLQNLAVTVRK
jgi:hypothetical protein